MNPAVARRTVRVAIGDIGRDAGTLTYAKEASRENSAFAYADSWLSAPERFSISPDLPLVQGHQYRRAPTRDDSVFHFCFADTEPDGWGCRVIARDHAKRRKATDASARRATSAALTEMDYLLGVDDISRVGALRLLDESGNCLRTIEEGGRGTPPLIELRDLISATRAVELGKETAADLRYLRGRGTSLGGMRPKCSILDNDGHLAIGKFPSVGDERCVTRGEVLALHLAHEAGINVAQSRIEMSDDVPVALIRRFDRVAGGGRVHYLSAASMLQASRQGDYAYTQIAERILVVSADPKRDLAELWRRIVFNLLITNVDDHLQNHGFLYVGNGLWRLAPAFDINPFPDKDPELKLWLTEDSGPVDSIESVLAAAPRFQLPKIDAIHILQEVHTAVRGWKRVAKSAAVGMKAADLDEFEPAFEHAQTRAAAKAI
ncbi:serine/threonine-protein kinase HipA [Pararobbsia alpina]|uniref:type II toxin-antitoxin system HipA family toxin n=1 Tax=Pararobbsia alpina TaxID=621374 RepID=UPI0039A6797C